MSVFLISDRKIPPDVKYRDAGQNSECICGNIIFAIRDINQKRIYPFNTSRVFHFGQEH